MKTRALLLALPFLAVVACTTDNRASVELRAICATTDDCKFQSTCSNTLMGEPALDADQTGNVWIPIEAANQAPNNADLNRGRVNTNDAHVDTIVLDFTAAGLGKTSYPTNQTIPAGGTTVLGVYVIPASLNAQSALQTYAGTALRTLVVNVSVRGYYDDGTRFETGDFPVSVRVCRGCIPACPTGTSLTCPGNMYQYPRSCQ